MSGLIPMAMFGIEVPPGDIAVPAGLEIPAAFRITMAAIDPSEETEEGEPQRATLKVIRQPLGLDDEDDDDDDEDDDFDPDEMDRILAGEDDDDDDSDDEEVNGGPSDPSKSKKAQLIAKLQKLREEEDLDMEDDDDEGLPNGINGLSAKAKGKLPAGSDDEADEDDDDDDEEDDMDEFVICTLDPNKNYQQPLDITIGEREMVYFKVSGGYSIHLTGNYVEPQEDQPQFYDPEDDEDDEYDLEPDEDELDDMDEDEEEDDLDDMEDPRITELDDDDIPALIKAAKPAKGNKRSAPEDDAAETLDEMIAAEKVNGEPKLSKKQLKKLKKNDGSAIGVENAASKSDKKVQFAKELEQGPTPTKGDKNKATLGVKVIQGVTLDDKKLGTGPAAKSGDRVSMRYIGKLEKDGKVFDSNKKGKPFSFKLGSGEVIKGWDIGVAGMSIGGERRLTIPAHLAYGSKGAPPSIPPNATLSFDVKLLEVNKGGK